MVRPKRHHKTKAKGKIASMGSGSGSGSGSGNDNGNDNSSGGTSGSRNGIGKGKGKSKSKSRDEPVVVSKKTNNSTCISAGSSSSSNSNRRVASAGTMEKTSTPAANNRRGSSRTTRGSTKNAALPTRKTRSSTAAESKVEEERSQATSSKVTSNTKRKLRETKSVHRIQQSKKRKIDAIDTGRLETRIQSLSNKDTETRSKDMNQNTVSQSVQKNKDKIIKNKMDSGNELDRNDQIWASELPFHVDVSARKAFYFSIKLDAPTAHYAEDVNKAASKDGIVWKVNVGDTVAIHVDLDRTARNRVAKNLKGGYELYPYTVTWWVAEIIAIYRYLSDNEAQELRKKVSDSDGLSSLDEKQQERGSFQVEVRWLYRKVDIPGAFNRKTNSCENDNGLMEVFETDDVGEISATALLGQVIVHCKENIPEDPPTRVNDMPLTHCFCHRSWSLHRKTLIPIGSAKNRFQRGMLYSRYMSRGSATRAAFEEALSNNKTTHINRRDKKQDWQEVFEDAIGRLTLAKASAVEHGAQLIGRTKEQRQIKKFLINAIRAVNTKEKVDLSNSNMCSLFIGGPPGTGKTASVTSILYQLRQEQAKGSIPEFTSVYLNGMETRHPFDIYVRLWEAVSPNKEKASADEALARLELYFAGEGRRKRLSKEVPKLEKRQAIVLLVDEIDYLVTKKQTVLYNLFDWPVRGYNGNTKAQLIVIGISNTLNLPDRLHVRLQSRIGRERCVYSSYSDNESQIILKGKLGISETGDKSIFKPDAIKFAARKISVESGDIRKVFHLCKATAENVFMDLKLGKRKFDDTNSKLPGVYEIGIGDIQQTARKMFGTVLCRAVTTASVFEALLFISLASLRRTSGQERGRFNLEELQIKMKGVASASGNLLYLPSPSYNEILDMLPRLAESGIISHSTPNGMDGVFGTNGFTGTIVGLNMEDYEVLGALRDTPHEALAVKHLQTTLLGGSFS